MNLLEEEPQKNIPQPMAQSMAQPLVQTSVSSSSFLDGKMIIIFILLVFLLFAYLGINFLSIFGSTLDKALDIFTPLINGFFGNLFQASGSVINKSADVVGDTAKTSIDIAEGAVQNIGNLLIKSSAKAPPDPNPDTSDNKIQNTVGSSKAKWCLVGEYENKRGCIDIKESDKCLSGQVFPSEQQCLNPAQYHSIKN